MMDDRLRILDTDMLSLIQRADSQATRRLKALPPRQRGVTVITLEEQMRGRLAHWICALLQSLLHETPF